MTSVLVIDDDADIREMLGQLLSALGYKASAAENGQLGLKLYQSEPANVVLLDIFMPEKAGLDTLRDLLRHDPKARVIAMSGGGRFNRKEILEIAMYMGARKRLQKPFTSEELKAAIEEVILMPDVKETQAQDQEATKDPAPRRGKPRGAPPQPPLSMWTGL